MSKLLMSQRHIIQAGVSLRGQNQAMKAAQQLYLNAYRSNWLMKIWSFLSSRSPYLLDLTEVSASCIGQGYEYIGLRAVSLDRILGSASIGRCYDFDTDFRPLKTHNEARWLAVAAARYAERPLPPVALLQVSDIYFVEDGHHRISVARALGETFIEAKVTVWQVVGALPWEQRRRLAQLTNRGTEEDAAYG